MLTYAKRMPNVCFTRLYHRAAGAVDCGSILEVLPDAVPDARIPFQKVTRRILMQPIERIERCSRVRASGVLVEMPVVYLGCGIDDCG